MCEEVVIQDQDQEIEILEVVESKEAKIKKEKEESEEVSMFKEKPWTNLRKKIVSKQGNQVPEPVDDNRTPYQIRTEAPMEPGMCLLEINDHIKKAMVEIDDFLKNKARDTQAFLPLSLSKKVTEHYGSSLKPNFDLDPELATQLEGLLSGVAFSGLGKKASSFTLVDLGRMCQATFNLVEIVSFLITRLKNYLDYVHLSQHLYIHYVYLNKQCSTFPYFRLGKTRLLRNNVPKKNSF